MTNGQIDKLTKWLRKINQLIFGLSHETASQFPTNLGPVSRRFAIILYILALSATFLALYIAVSGSFAATKSELKIIALLGANLLLIIYIGYLVIRRFQMLMDASSSTGIGSKLHVRYVRLFILAAAIPAIIVAIFSVLTIGRGVQSWLSGQVKGAISATADFGNEYLRRVSDAVEVEIVAMASDLDAAAPQFNTDRSHFNKYLASQAERRGFVGVYLIKENGEIVSKAERPNDVPKYDIPDLDDFATANAGVIDINIEQNLEVIALYRLNGLPGIYLRAVRLPNPEQLGLIKQADQVISAYRSIEARQSQVLAVFALGYFETVLMIIIGSGWLGLETATSISRPIARLADGAQKVRAGDYSTRIVPEFKVQELTALTNTFNLMTEELGNQKLALENSKEEALARSAFIQAVLEGVSAGVVSLDKNRKVLAANGSAANLLGVSSSDLIKKGLLRIAPEFTEVLEGLKPNSTLKMHIERKIEDANNLFDVRATYAGEDIVVTFDEVSSLVSAQRQAAWKDVARRIAHEIKNPLTPIQLSAERLSRKFSKQINEDKEIFDRLTNTIVRQVTDIGRMVDEFSSFARMPAPRFEISDICEMTRQTVFSQKIAFPDIEYMIDVPPEPILVSMDTRLVSQAVLNILKNAAESIHSRQSRGEDNLLPQIKTEIEVLDCFARIRIIDNGVGFPKHGRDRLLEPYVTTREKGTGLGLAIVSRVFEEHGGGLKLLDREDKQQGGMVELSVSLNNERAKNGV